MKRSVVLSGLLFATLSQAEPQSPALRANQLGAPKPIVPAGVATPAGAGMARPLPTLKPLPLGLVNGELRGYVDLHAHPMSYLGFGRKALHGAPGFGTIVPAGTHECNKGELRVSSIDQALGSCNSTHGGWGLDNQCGDYLRAGIINYALDDHFAYKVGFERNPHGDHEHAGYPDFRFWPHHTSILHQQMWWEWIKRAYDGGLRVMVALTVNSELLAEILNGDGPYDDKSVAEKQIDEMIRFVDDPRNGGFMRVVRSAAELRDAVKQNKLAIVLGMEVDKLGNFGKPGVASNEAAVRAEIQNLYRKGIRYIFPIHLIDNSFGGTAVYNLLFNFANKHANGYHFRVAHSADPNITYSSSMTDGPPGSENSLILGLKGFLEGVGQIPAPCFNDAIKCSPPPGKVRCCGSYEKVLDILNPSPELDAYKFIPRGHQNLMGLTRLGEIAVNEMMKLGLMIDVDHMSERSMTRTIELAEQVPGYPLVMGHNGIRGPGGNERGAPEALVRRLSALGGMFGVGTADTTPDAFITGYRRVRGVMGPKAGVAIGSDVNGFEPLPHHSRPATQAASDQYYARFLAESGISSKQQTGNHVWDYVLEGGVSHYGLMPEFLFDVQTSANGAEVMNGLLQSSERFAQMWEKAEQAARKVRSLPAGGNYTYDVPPIPGLCPSTRVAGDAEFGGHGPHVTGKVTLGISPDGASLQASVGFDAKETEGDGSEVKGTWTVNVGEPAPSGLRYSRIRSPNVSNFDQVLSGGGRNELTEGCDGGEHVITPASGPVARLIVVGDTGGGDISNDNDCNCDTRIVRIELKPVDVTLAPR